MSGKPRLLVIDDDENLRKIIRHIFEQAGFEVYAAENGDSGVKAAVSNPPNAILMDVMMPEKDGFDACSELRRVGRTQDVPIIILTAKPKEESYTHALYKGATAYVTKPFQNEELVSLVRKLIEEAERPKPVPPPPPTKKRAAKK